MSTLNIGTTAIEIKTAIQTVRANIAFLQGRIDTIKLAPVGSHGALRFFKQRLEIQEITLNWLMNCQRSVA
jgi:hypothetical protein